VSRAPFHLDGAWFRAQARRAAEAQLADRADLARGFADLALAAADPELHDVVRLARAPLVPSKTAEPVVTAAAAVQPTTRVPAKLVVPASVLAAIRAHVASAAPGFEVGGRVIVNGEGAAVDYVPLANRAAGPRRFDFRSSWLPAPGERSLITHSHPSGSAMPSAGDLAWARGHGLDWIGIWHAPASKLSAFTVDGEWYEELPVVAQHPAAPIGRSRGYRVDLIEGLVFSRDGQHVPGGFEAVQRRLMVGRHPR
jgi:proteasome lid subunit RPN8/RPN11